MHLKRVLSSIVLMAIAAGAQTGSAPTKKPLSPSAAASVQKNGECGKDHPAAQIF